MIFCGYITGFETKSEIDGDATSDPDSWPSRKALPRRKIWALMQCRVSEGSSTQDVRIPVSQDFVAEFLDYHGEQKLFSVEIKPVD